MSPAVRSPLPGEAAALDSVDDPVFAGGVVGPGLALRPPTGRRLDVLAPVTGTIVKTTPHAFVVRADDGAAVLVHLGIDTVALRGQGFEAVARQGERVDAGQVVCRWDPSGALGSGLDVVSPVVVLEPVGAAIEPAIPVPSAVGAGDALFTII